MLVHFDFFVSKTPNLFFGQKILFSVKDLKYIFFRFSKFNFFLNFYFLKTSNSSFISQTLNYNLLNFNYFNFNLFQKKICNYSIVSFNYKGWVSMKSHFFCEFRIIGLGFKLKRISFDGNRALKFDIGFGHYILYLLPLEIKCIKRKRKFVLFSQDPILLNNTVNQIETFKLLNPYKIRGLKNTKKILRIKEGKKQSQR
jgi:hypothetical protein